MNHQRSLTRCDERGQPRVLATRQYLRLVYRSCDIPFTHTNLDSIQPCLHRHRCYISRRSHMRQFCRGLDQPSRLHQTIRIDNPRARKILRELGNIIRRQEPCTLLQRNHSPSVPGRLDDV